MGLNNQRFNLSYVTVSQFGMKQLERTFGHWFKGEAGVISDITIACSPSSAERDVCIF